MGQAELLGPDIWLHFLSTLQQNNIVVVCFVDFLDLVLLKMILFQTIVIYFSSELYDQCSFSLVLNDFAKFIFVPFGW